MPEPFSFEHDFVQQATFKEMYPKWLNNFAENLPIIRQGKNFSDLPPVKGRPALLIGAGPSIHKYDHLKLIAKSKFKGVIFSSDRMLKEALDMGIEPYAAVTVDGSPHIAEFYREAKGKYHAILCTLTTHPEVVKVLRRNGNEIYWFNQILDNYMEERSLTRTLVILSDYKDLVLAPSNVGSTMWNIAAILGCNPIILVGFDFSYDTNDIEETSYYNAIKNLCKGDEEKVKSFYSLGKNPFFENEYLTDIVWRSYKEELMLMIKGSPNIKTINATGRGQLWEKPIICQHLKKVLDEYA